MTFQIVKLCYCRIKINFSSTWVTISSLCVFFLAGYGIYHYPKQNITRVQVSVSIDTTDNSWAAFGCCRQKSKTKVCSLKLNTCSYARLFTSVASNKRSCDLKVILSQRGSNFVQYSCLSKEQTYIGKKGERSEKATEGGQHLFGSRSLLWVSEQAGDCWIGRKGPGS